MKAHFTASQTHRLAAISCLLVIGLTGFVTPANAAKSLTKSQIVEAQKAETERAKKSDKSYQRQAKALGQYYTKLAQKLSKSGINVQPLLAASAYFNNESKK